MTEIKSTPRIDELFKKASEEGLDDREKEELLFLLRARGMKVVRITIDEIPEDETSVH